MPTRFQYFDFETEISRNGDAFPVTVEVTLSSYGSDVAIEGVKVKLEGGTELVLSDKQMKDIYEEIWERVND